MQLDLCYTISNSDTFKSIYPAYFHSIMKYGISFWCNLFKSKKIFTLQKKTARITAGVKPIRLCRGLFKRLEIFPPPCEYVFSLLQTNSVLQC
jgi:hypothetical protein